VICALLAKDPARRPSLDQARRMLVKAAREGSMAETEPLPAPEHAPVFPEGERAQAMAPVLVPPPSVPATEVSPLDPEEAPSTDAQTRGSRTPTALLLSALVLLALLVVAGLYLVLQANSGPAQTRASTTRTGNQSAGHRHTPGGRNTHPATTHPASHSPTTPSPTPSTPTPTATPPSPSTSATTAPTGTSTSGSGGVPVGFVLHTDPTGYRVAVPAGWVERPSGGTYTDFVDPQTGGFLRVDQTSTPQPDPAADWRSQEPYVAKHLPGYRRVSIAPVSYRGWKAADWQFTWHGANGVIHVLDRGFVTGPDHGYALYWSMPQSAWKQSLQQFQVVADSFQPAA
jgi:eukaryotic-like serine/threonine-protein kinase